MATRAIVEVGEFESMRCFNCVPVVDVTGGGEFCMCGHFTKCH